MLAWVCRLVSSLLVAVVVYAVMRVKVASERRFAEEKERTFAAKLEAIVAQVSDVTARSLAARERELAERNAAQVRPLFDRMKADLDDFRKAASDAQKENARLGASL